MLLKHQENSCTGANKASKFLHGTQESLRKQNQVALLYKKKNTNKYGLVFVVAPLTSH